MKIKITLLLVSVCLLSACKKKDNAANNQNTQSGTTTGGSTGGTFTPPATNYFMISDSTHTPNMMAVTCDMNGGFAGVQKPFNKLNFGSCQLRIWFDSLNSSGYRNIRGSVAEGGYREFNIDTTANTAHNSVRVEVDTQEPDGYYYYRATGKIYVNKTNGKLRFTSNGTLQIKGRKYLGPGFTGYIYNRNVKFSVEEGAQF